MEQALSSYKVFYEVAKAGNISKAGKTLQISQPAISKSIVKLEEQIGVKLFHIREFHIGHLKIGSSTTLCKYLLVPYLKEYLKENPHMKITIENQATAKTIQKIENHRLDVGAVVLSRFKHGMKFIHIMELILRLFILWYRDMSILQKLLPQVGQ